MVCLVRWFRGVAEARRETSLDFHSPPAEPSRGPTFPRLEDESVRTNFARRCAAIFTRPQHNQKLWPCTWSVWWQVPARCSLNHIVSPWTLLQSPSCMLHHAGSTAVFILASVIVSAALQHCWRMTCPSPSVQYLRKHTAFAAVWRADVQDEGDRPREVNYFRIAGVAGLDPAWSVHRQRYVGVICRGRSVR